ncbi:MAG: multicopper oxidase domain-containing protein [Rhodoferax sp.]|uniref:multicopper oxidase domain-containing protein n=1 Tax=Rhodoferax sp. TaxID=50421 RepID=UPI0027258B84|nr:multicopper oxidase domain-containing protein [Rhodoferax sp.]MDO8448461.1 multicopper oxidase domain-containing protein [Rhodoferax sp.]
MTSSDLRKHLLPIAMAASALLAGQAGAAVYVQCPGDTNGDGVPETPTPGVVCKHLGAGDGFSTMADGKPLYGFGFSDLTGVLPAQAISTGLLAANFAAPTIELKEGDKFYLTLTNVGMVIRPDLFDPHTVHFHGFPNQAPVFDGMPEGSFGINMGSSVTYFYNVTEPGTYIYHCHMEATEHMQMGMLGQIYVRPAQDGTTIAGYSKFAYNDGDGSTGYHKSYPIQLGSVDHNFHDASESVQPLPFAEMKDTYATLNGRGYPDTVNPGPLPSPTVDGASINNDNQSQKISALITATAGEKILLRLSNLNVTNYYTVTTLGLPMRVVGGGAHIARGPGGKNLYYDTGSVTLGGGETSEVIVDTAGVTPGTYFLYTTNLNYLSNNDQDFGGMMTEIVVQ